jgi:adenylylsulfate kinase
MAFRNHTVNIETAFTVWLTGLPCAGKSTLAIHLGEELRKRQRAVEILDGDALRASLCKGLGFSKIDREENVARIGWICNLLNSHGVVAISAVVSPYRGSRDRLRRTIPNFIEVYVKASLSVCIQRDIKGMYAKAIAGQLPRFTGIGDPYEEPLSPEVVVGTESGSIAQCVGSIMAKLERLGFLTHRPSSDVATTFEDNIRQTAKL